VTATVQPLSGPGLFIPALALIAAADCDYHLTVDHLDAIRRNRLVGFDNTYRASVVAQ
jgi:hypothetical protein